MHAKPSGLRKRGRASNRTTCQRLSARCWVHLTFSPAIYGGIPLRYFVFLLCKSFWLNDSIAELDEGSLGAAAAASYWR